MARDDAREMNLLDQYWNAAPADRRYVSDELDRSLRRTVDRFESADDAPEPEPEFVDNLWRQLSGESLTQSMATAGPRWSGDDADEDVVSQTFDAQQPVSIEPYQQTTWRHRAKQFAEMAAAVVVLVLVIGGLVFAYQNLAGVGGDESGPAGEGDTTTVPSLTSVDEIQFDAPVVSTGIARINGQDYIVSLASSESGGEPSGIELQVARPNADGELEEISTLEAPVPWSNYLMTAGIDPIVSNDGVLFLPLVEGEQPGLWMVDISDPESPTELAYIETEVLGTSIATSDDLLVMTGLFGGDVMLYDISEPESPQPLGSFEATSPTNPVLTIDGSHLYMVRGSGLSIVDISDPARPEEVGAFENTEWEGPEQAEGISPVDPEGVTDQVLSPGTFSDIVVANDYAYLTAGHREILILDVSDPAAPEEVGRFERDDHTFRLAESGDFMYVLGAEAVEDEETNVRLKLSLEVIDISDQGNPRSIDRLEDFAADFESAGFSLMIQRFAHGGDALLAYGNMPSSYLAHIDWVEPEASEVVDPTPTVAPEAPTPTQGVEAVPSDLTVEEIYQRADQNLRRDGMIYHATITTDAEEDSFRQGGSRYLWVDAERGVARHESIAHLHFEETNITMETSGIIADGASYTLYEHPESGLDSVRSQTCYGASEAVATVLGCPGATERSTTTVERGNYQGQPAIILVKTGTARGSDETIDFTNRRYLDPESFLPIAEKTEGDHTYGPVNLRSVYQHEFIDRYSIPADHFDPISLALTRLDRADPGFPVYWLGAHFEPPGDLPPLVLFDGGSPDVPEAGYDVLLSYRLPDPTFAPSQTIRSEVVIEEWARDDWEAEAASEFETHWEERCHEAANVPLEQGQATIFMGYGESKSPTRPGYHAPMPPGTEPAECGDTPFTRFEAVAEFEGTVLFVSIPGESEYQSREALEAVLRGLHVR